MNSVLARILNDKKEEVAQIKRNRSVFTDLPPQPPRRDFMAALTAESSLAVIAEVKKASPSKGVICADFNPEMIAEQYKNAGADAVSVLTDVKYFMGDTSYLTAVRATIPMPVLRKDFIVDPVQVEQTAALGADAMLLIVAALDDYQLAELDTAAREFGIATLIEIHNHAELERAMRIDPRCLGINNRDLTTFVTDIQVTLALMPHIPEEIVVVSESGIAHREQAELVKEAGARAVLVGESLMREEDPAALLHGLKV